MKKSALLLITLLTAFSLQAQDSGGGGGGGNQGGGNEDLSDKRNALSVQAFKMGVLAIDYERYLGNRMGLQGTAGLFGLELAFKIHFKPSIQSSSLSFTLGNQFKNFGFESAFGEDYDLKSVSPRVALVYEYRSRKHLTFSTGIGMQRFNYSETIETTMPWPPYVSTTTQEYQDWSPFFRLTIGAYFAL